MMIMMVMIMDVQGIEYVPLSSAIDLRSLLRRLARWTSTYERGLHHVCLAIAPTHHHVNAKKCPATLRAQAENSIKQSFQKIFVKINRNNQNHQTSIKIHQKTNQNRQIGRRARNMYFPCFFLFVDLYDFEIFSHL